MESLRQELQPDIRVTVIEPGAVATELPSNIAHDEIREGAQAFCDTVPVTAPLAEHN